MLRYLTFPCQTNFPTLATAEATAAEVDSAAAFRAVELDLLIADTLPAMVQVIKHDVLHQVVIFTIGNRLEQMEYQLRDHHNNVFSRLAKNMLIAKALALPPYEEATDLPMLSTSPAIIEGLK